MKPRWALLTFGFVLCQCDTRAPKAQPPPPPKVEEPVGRRAPNLPTDAESVSLRELAQSLAAPGGSIENPAALESFFLALDSPLAHPPTVIAALGNSLIAGDGVVDIMRARLTQAFGDAGRGLLLADRLAAYGGRPRSAMKAWGWTPSTLAPPLKFRWPFGISGVHHTAQYAGAASLFKLDGEVSADVWWYDGPGAGGLKVFVDDTLVTHLTPTEHNNGRRTRVMLPPSGHELKLVAQSKGTVIHGVVLEKEKPGIVLDMLGVPSVDASLFLTADEEVFEDQLRARKPALTMLMFGGNETKRIGWGRSTREKVATDLRKLITRVKEATRTDCWVVGPLDAVTSKSDGGTYLQRKELLEVVALEREIALDEGCAWFDLYAAMGGAGSIKRFDQAGFMHPDLVHPKGKGLDVLGQLLTDALFNAYRNSQANEPTAATSGR